MSMIPEEDLWSSEDFELMVTSALISFYESGIHNNRNADKIDEKMIKRARKDGLFIPGPDRVIWEDSIDGLDGIPEKGSVFLAFTDERIKQAKVMGEKVENYGTIIHFQKIDKFPNSIRRTSPGKAYQFIQLFTRNEGGIEGNNFYFALTKNGNTRMQFPNNLKYNPFDKVLAAEKERLEKTFLYAMQFYADKKHTWCITAEDGESKVAIGANFESVKSLLFSRELPMTPTGRKRPILHLVHAHQRRMKEGVEVDIENFLRGTREIIMDGTKYTVDVPKRFYEKELKHKVC